MAQEVITVQSTTSTRDSGLYDFILPIFLEKSGIVVNVVAVGTGQAIRNARDCNGDVLLVHSKPDEEKFVADGYGVKRHDLMYNDFVIIGPKADPAGISGMKSVKEALQKIASTKNSFASRGDDSGTNKAELRLWGLAGIDPKVFSGKWYLETGSGMGKTLNVAVGKNSYTMSDRATWTKYGNKQDHVIVVEGDPPLFNQYGVSAVSGDKCPKVDTVSAAKFVDWLISDEGQKAIGDYRIGEMQVFFPNAEHAVN
jgi:tungstate transport system substrate-binding protein